MDKPLSYSAYKRLTTCAKYYEFYDIKKERPEGGSTALIVGTIVDQVVMAKLEKKEPLDFKALLADAKNPTHRIDFFDHDLDCDFVDLVYVEKFAKGLGWKGSDIKSALSDFIKSQEALSDAQYEVLKEAVWQSLEVKIQCMLDSFDKWILPQIKEVHEVQYHLDDGKTHGYLDFVATMNDGRKVLFDLKTSARPYEKDAVLKSPQLSLYAAMYDIEHAGFIILVKIPNKNKDKTCPNCEFKETGGQKKKCPECKSTLDFVMNPTSYSQLLIDEVPQHNKDLTKEAMYDSIKLIDNGVFPRNLNACFWMYGKPCPYVSKCWGGK